MTNPASKIDIIIVYLKCGVLDLSVGLLISVIAIVFLKAPSNIWLSLVGMIAAVAPDIDLPLKSFLNNPKIRSHRELFHKPLLIVTLLILATILSHGNSYLLVFTLGVIWHFFHDTLGDLNWPGLPLWPLPYRLGLHSHADGKENNLKWLQLLPVAKINYREKDVKNQAWVSKYKKLMAPEIFAALLISITTVIIIVATTTQ